MMKKSFAFEDIYKVEKVELLYKNLGDKKFKVAKMEKENNWWRVELEEADNEKLLIYKFVINENIRLNDYNADKYVEELNGEIFSVYNSGTDINSNKKIIGNTISCNLGNNKKNYVVRRDRHIEVVVDIMNLKGIHSATIIRYQPDGHIYCIEERAVENKFTTNLGVRVSFLVHMNWNAGDFYKGMWTYSVFADGKIIKQDYFMVQTINREICNYSRMIRQK